MSHYKQLANKNTSQVIHLSTQSSADNRKSSTTIK